MKRNLVLDGDEIPKEHGCVEFTFLGNYVPEVEKEMPESQDAAHAVLESTAKPKKRRSPAAVTLYYQFPQLVLMAGIAIEITSSFLPVLGRLLVTVGATTAASYADYLVGLLTIAPIVAVVAFLMEHLGVFLVPITFVGAGLLFRLRGTNPKTYGLLEILVGMLTIGASNVQTLTFQAAIGLLGGIYIIIRGLDNVAKGIDKEGLLKNLFTGLFDNPKRTESGS